MTDKKLLYRKLDAITGAHRLRNATLNRLKAAGVERVSDLVARREVDLLLIKGFGGVALREVRAFLEINRLHLRRHITPKEDQKYRRQRQYQHPVPTWEPKLSCAPSVPVGKPMEAPVIPSGTTRNDPLLSYVDLWNWLAQFKAELRVTISNGIADGLKQWDESRRPTT